MIATAPVAWGITVRLLVSKTAGIYKCSRHFKYHANLVLDTFTVHLERLLCLHIYWGLVEHALDWLLLSRCCAALHRAEP